MTFLQPDILWGLPLILLPVIIHLINRLRHRPQPWAAMQFLLAANRSSTSQAKLKQFLILLLRTLAVLALVLFLGRPLTGGWLGWAVNTSPEAILLLLDRSGSMETSDGSTSLRQKAIEMMTEAAAPFSDTSQFVLIDSASLSAQSLISMENLEEHPSVSPTHTRSDIPSMLQQALDWIADNRPGSVEIWIPSDWQENNWSPQDERWQSVRSQFNALPQTVRFRILEMRSPGRPNHSLALESSFIRETAEERELVLKFDVRIDGTPPTSLPLEITLGDNVSALEIDPPGNEFHWEHSLPLPEGVTEGWGALSLPPDANPQDNQAWFTFKVSSPPTAVVVGETTEAAQILSLAAATQTGGELIPARIVSAAALGPEVISEATLLVWAAPLPDQQADLVRDFADSGGVVVFFPTLEEAPGTFESFAWSGWKDGEEAVTIADWNHREGALRDGASGASLPLQEIGVLRHNPVVGSLTPLATLQTGETLVGRRQLGSGQVYFCTTLPESNHSNLAEGTVLVPMLQRLLETGTRRWQRSTQLTVGNLSMADSQRKWTSVAAKGGRDIATEAGIYENQGRRVAANLPDSESRPTRMEPDALLTLFSDLEVSMFQETEGNSNLQGEAWRLFLAGMLVFLMIEGLLILPNAEQKPIKDPSTKAAA